MLHSQVMRLDRAVDRIVPEMKDLKNAQDGSEVEAWELQTLTFAETNGMAPKGGNPCRFVVT